MKKALLRFFLNLTCVLLNKYHLYVTIYHNNKLLEKDEDINSFTGRLALYIYGVRLQRKKQLFFKTNLKLMPIQMDLI